MIKLGTALACAATLLTTLAAATPALAQDYPDRVVTLVVPFAPGGASDQAARFISVPLGEALGQSVIVENHAGAGGNLGIGYAANADADGYTLLLASSAFVVNPNISSQQTFDPLESFEFITQIGYSPNVLVAPADGEIQSFEDLVRIAGERPGDVYFSSAGVGTTPHLTGELINVQAGIEMTHVPYQGAGPAVVAVLGKEVELSSAALSVVLPYIKDGSLIPIVQTGSVRSPSLPDTPTLVESGYPEAVSETFQAIFAPKGTPEPIVNTLIEKLLVILETPAMQEQLTTVGFEKPVFGPLALRDRVVGELGLWANVIESAGIERQ
jgi:tripartite-type tricarboxylate transporter receptor subunit TctC